jgi:hypothetical protein
MREYRNPSGAGYQKENSQGMIFQPLPNGVEPVLRRLPAFGRPSFIHEFGGNNSNHQSRPVSDGVSKECAGMSFGIGVAVENDPAEQDGAGNDAQRVPAKKRILTFSGHGGSDDVGASWVEPRVIEPRNGSVGSKSA